MYKIITAIFGFGIGVLGCAILGKSVGAILVIGLLGILCGYVVYNILK